MRKLITFLMILVMALSLAAPVNAGMLQAEAPSAAVNDNGEAAGEAVAEYDNGEAADEDAAKDDGGEADDESDHEPDRATGDVSNEETSDKSNEDKTDEAADNDIEAADNDIEAADNDIKAADNDSDVADNDTDADWQGKGTEDDPYQIASVEDLQKLAARVNAGEIFKNTVFRMTADVALGADWTPVGALRSGSASGGEGANINPFGGIFDGGGHLLTVAPGGMPLFGYVRGAVIRSLNIYGSRIAADGLVANYVVDTKINGALCGTVAMTASFENVTLKSGSSTLRSGFIGGMAHPESSNTFSQTASQDGLSFTNCTVESGVTIGYDRSCRDIGSFAGQLNGTMTGCVSEAAVFGTDHVGGLVGSKATSMGSFRVTDCRFGGSVTATGSGAGGIAGSGYEHESAPNTRAVVIENCQSTGTITGAEAVGGILGSEGGLWQAWDNGIGEIRSNRFTGKVSGNEAVGGIIGYYNALNCYTLIENNYYAKGCGADRGIGQVRCVDSSVYSDKKSTPAGWIDGIYCFNSAEDSLNDVKAAINPDSPYSLISRTKHNRTDDPLGKNAADLCYTDEPEKDPEKDPDDPEPTPALRVVSLTVSGNYKTAYTTGEALDLSGAGFTVTFSDGSQKTIRLSDVTVSGYDAAAPGEQTVLIRYQTASAAIRVTVTPPSTKIRVTVSVYGDSVHDSDSDGRVHTLSGGGLTLWAAPASYEASSSWTVWDAIRAACRANGLTPVTRGSLGTVYITGITRGGVTLSEFSNGARSGWMYTLNGSHPVLGAAQQYIKNGDVIVLHYSDDYTRESGNPAPASAGSDEAVKKVENLIAAIGSPVTKADLERIEKARKAYNALNYAQKKAVKNYDKLKAAEEALKSLTGSGSGEAKPLTEAERRERILKTQSYREIYVKTGDYIESLGAPTAGAVGGRWMALGLARSGRTVPESYLESVSAFVAQAANENEQLHKAKSTENAGEILALTALGRDVTNVAGHNLLKGLTDFGYVKKQGINGPIWALIAFDSAPYDIPANNGEGEAVTREGLVSYLLSQQLEDGGWALSGSLSDSDLTGMALTALAPYYRTRSDVKAAVDRALATLSEMQNSDGSFSTFGGDGGFIPTSESTAQVLTALSALGIDAHTDARFVKDGHSVLSALCAFYVEGSGFRHLLNGDVDGMATEQAYYALAAYFRMLDGKTSLYDMSDVGIARAGAALSDAPEEAEEVTDERAEENGSDEPQEMVSVISAAQGTDGTPSGASSHAVLILAAAAACAAVILFFMARRKKKESEDRGN